MWLCSEAKTESFKTPELCPGDSGRSTCHPSGTWASRVREQITDIPTCCFSKSQVKYLDKWMEPERSSQVHAAHQPSKRFLVGLECQVAFSSRRRQRQHSHFWILWGVPVWRGLVPGHKQRPALHCKQWGVNMDTTPLRNLSHYPKFFIRPSEFKEISRSTRYLGNDPFLYYGLRCSSGVLYPDVFPLSECSCFPQFATKGHLKK